MIPTIMRDLQARFGPTPARSQTLSFPLVNHGLNNDLYGVKFESQSRSTGTSSRCDEMGILFQIIPSIRIFPELHRS